MLGAVGIEMAAELKLVEPTQTVKLIHSRDKLLSSEPLPDDFKDKSLLLLQEAGVEVVLGRRVMKVIPDQSAEHTSYTLILSDGTQMKAGHVISAISNGVPSTSFLPSTALDPNNFVKIISKFAHISPLSFPLYQNTVGTSNVSLTSFPIIPS